MTKKNPPQRTGASGGTEGRVASGFEPTAEEMAVLQAAEQALVTAPEGQRVAAEPPRPRVRDTQGNVLAQGDVTVTSDPVLLAISPEVSDEKVAEVKERFLAATAGVPPKKTKMEQLVERLELVLKRATVDLDFTDPRTRPGREAAKRDAQAELGGLREQYWDLLRRGLGAMFLVGDRDRQTQFVSEAASRGVIAVAADEVYTLLAGEVEGFMRTDRQFEPADYARLLTAIAKLCVDLGLTEAPRPSYKPEVLRSFDAVVAYVRERVRDEVGDQLNKYFLQHRIWEEAWKIRYSKDAAPVVVAGATVDETKGLESFFGNRTTKFRVDGGVFDTVLTKGLSALQTRLGKS